MMTCGIEIGVKASESSTQPERGTARISGWGIRDRRGFAALCLIEVLDSSTRTGLLTFIAVLLLAKGLPAGWAALSVPLILAGGMAGKLACGLLAERLGIVRMIVLTEIATSGGRVIPGTKTARFLSLIEMAGYVPLSGRTMEFNEHGHCVSGCN